MARASVMCTACGAANVVEIEEEPTASITAAQWAVHVFTRHPEIEDASSVILMTEAVE